MDRWSYKYHTNQAKPSILLQWFCFGKSGLRSLSPWSHMDILTLGPWLIGIPGSCGPRIPDSRYKAWGYESRVSTPNLQIVEQCLPLFKPYSSPIHIQPPQKPCSGTGWNHIFGYIWDHDQGKGAHAFRSHSGGSNMYLLSENIVSQHPVVYDHVPGWHGSCGSTPVSDTPQIMEVG